jgi:PAS domain S-box-containing protein
VIGVHAELEAGIGWVETITELLASAMSFLPEAVLLTTPRLGVAHVVFANEHFQQLTGYSMQEIIGRDLEFLRGPETDASAFQGLSQDTCGEGILPYELLLHKKDGTPFWDQVRTRGLRFNDHDVYCVQVHSDISRFKEVENQFLTSQKKGEASRLVSTMIHDFNNLLTAIMVYAGLLTSKVQNDSQLQSDSQLQFQLQRYTDEIMASAHRASDLVAQIRASEMIAPKKPTLLLVEDEELVRSSVDTALSMQGYKVLPAASAEEAMSISQSHSGEIHLMVTDLHMPGMSGMELAREIRAARPGTKILFVSGSSDNSVLQGLEAGREDFFSKPFTPSALARKIEALLNWHSDE